MKVVFCRFYFTSITLLLSCHLNGLVISFCFYLVSFTQVFVDGWKPIIFVVAELLLI